MKLTKDVIDDPDMLPSKMTIKRTHWNGSFYTDNYESIKNPTKTKAMRMHLLNKIKDNAKNRGIEVKCMSDELLLYTKYIIDNAVVNCFYNEPYGYPRVNPFSRPIKDEPDVVMKHEMMMNIAKRKVFNAAEVVYRVIRGNEEFVGMTPSATAAAICYLVFNMMKDTRKINFNVTFNDIQDIILVNQVTIRKVCKKIQVKIIDNLPTDWLNKDI